MMNVWQEFPYDGQRMPAAPLRRLARTNSEPSRQLAGFAPRQRLWGSVHAMPLSAILTTSDQPVHSPDARVGQPRCGFLLVSGDARIVWKCVVVTRVPQLGRRIVHESSP